MKRKGEVSHRAPCTFSFNTTLQRPTPEGCNLLSLERDSPPRFTGRGRDVLNEESGERETRKGRGGKKEERKERRRVNDSVVAISPGTFI